jgi:hydrogenase expression/formation protein HypE
MSEEFVPSDLFLRVERKRRRRPSVRDERITLAHGSGGKAMHELIEGLFLEYLRNPLVETLEDQTVFELGANGHGVRLAFTTDSFVVTPVFFPGGDIGSLAINGTVNDLAMSGARPLYLSAGFILEEGFPIDELRCILASMRAAAEQAGVHVVTGDTKVVSKGAADQIFITTSGIGIIEKPLHISSSRAQVGDQVILSGSLGDHGVTVLVARGDLELASDIRSDTASLWSLVQDMLGVSTDIHCLRDLTRGGVGTTLNEIAMSGSPPCGERGQADWHRYPTGGGSPGGTDTTASSGARGAYHRRGAGRAPRHRHVKDHLWWHAHRRYAGGRATATHLLKGRGISCFPP